MLNETSLSLPPRPKGITEEGTQRLCMTAEDGKECYKTLPSENITTVVIVNTWQLQLLTQNLHESKK